MLSLSHNQRALWLVHRLAPASAAYNVALAAHLGAIREDAFLAAWRALAERHPSLRTVYPATGGRPQRRLEPPSAFDLAAVDGRSLSPAELTDTLAREARRPFDLAHGPVARLRLYRQGDGTYTMLFAMHHIGVDITSMAILLDELGTLYRAGAAALPAPQATFEDFVTSEARLLASPRGAELEAYWRRRLAGIPSLLRLPTDRPRPSRQRFAGATEKFQLDAALTRRLQELAWAQGVGLEVVLLAAFQGLLHRQSGEEVIVVGTPDAGRGGGPFGELVGYFVNPLPVRADLTADITWRRLLDQTSRRLAAARQHGEMPFPLLVERLDPPREPGCSPLFQVLFACYQGGEERLSRLLRGEGGVPIEIGPLSLTPLRLPEETAMLDLSLILSVTDGVVSGGLQYDLALFDPSTAAALVGAYQQLLTAMGEDPARLVVDAEEPTRQATAAQIRARSQQRAEIRRQRMGRRNPSRTDIEREAV